MSPMDGQEEFRGAASDYAGNAYREEAQLGAREGIPTEEYLDARERGGPSIVESLPGSDVAVELARISSRLESMERPRLGSGGGFGIGGQTLNFFARHSGVHGPGSHVWKEQLHANYHHQLANARQRMQYQYRDELRQGAAEFHQGADELRAELHRQKKLNLRLQEQLNLCANDGPMGVHEVGDLDPHFVKVPTSTKGKISIEPLDGSEIYKGLGAGFVQWGQLLLVKIDLAERACGFRWPEEYKVSRFGEFLRGKAARYFNQRVHSWWRMTPTLGFVMEKMVDSYRIVFYKQQTIKLFAERKEKGQSCNDHLLYLVALQEATNSGEELIMENIVKYAQPESQALIINQYHRFRTDYLAHAEEIVSFIQGLEDETVGYKKNGNTVVKLVTDTRRCHTCSQVGHIARYCRDKTNPIESGRKKALMMMIGFLTLERAVTCEVFRQSDGTPLQVTKRGKVCLHTSVDGLNTEIELSSAYFSPQLTRNLVSYGRLADHGCLPGQFQGRHAVLKNGKVVFYVAIKNYVMVIDRAVIQKDNRAIGEIVMSAVATVGSGSAVQVGKTIRSSQPKHDTGESAPTDRVGGVICSDLKGPITPRDRRGNRYLVNFVDHKTNYCRVFLSKTKDQAAQKFEHFLVYFEKRYNCCVHVLRTDDGGEYKNIDLFCRDTGVARQITEAGNQAGNGKAARMHRTVMNMVRCMIYSCDLPLSFWGDAVEYSAYVLNRMPKRSNPKRASPITMLTGRPPSLVDIAVFGSPCETYRDPKKNWLKQRSEQGIILGKCDEIKGFRVWLPCDRVIITTRHIRRVATLTDQANSQLKDVLQNGEEFELEELARTRQAGYVAMDHTGAARQVQLVGSREQLSSVVPEPTCGGTGQNDLRRSERAKQKSFKMAEADMDILTVLEPSRALVNAVTTAVTVDISPAPHDVVNAVIAAVSQVFRSEFSHLPDLKNYGEAMRSPDNDLWIRAHREELASLRANHTWRVVKAESNVPRLHTKWVHKKKRTRNGEIERYKARLVACGNEEVLGVNFLLTFTAVLDMTSAKAIFSIAWIWRVPARHFDVPSAYVRAAKEEGVDIHLYIPDGMNFTSEELSKHGVSTTKDLSLCMEKSLYGLKQAGRLWHQLLHATLTNIGYVQCITDTCLYYKSDLDGTTMVGTYVDDLLVTGTSDQRVDVFFSQRACLELKDLGLAEKFLGMRCHFDANFGYQIDQEATILELLLKYGLEKANAVRSPMGGEIMDVDQPVGGVLLPENGPGTPERLTIKTFQSLLGSLP
uniref:GK15001 putative n=1 Tax=Albugo laibachii Nc14 TaxID=890382 RepID=F0WE94_9STRA|nr:GK15001 putative [Albugo laibachii Nc14]|eukprot:CCA19525.1 GK15001 putative [Albugo laibachii Nc14]